MHRRHNLKHTHHRIVCSFLKLHGETRINNSFVSHELGDSKSNLSDLFHGLAAQRAESPADGDGADSARN